MLYLPANIYSVYKVDDGDDVYYVNPLDNTETSIRDIFSEKQGERYRKVLIELMGHMEEVFEDSLYILEFNDEWISENPNTWLEISQSYKWLFFKMFWLCIWRTKRERFTKVKETLRKKRISLSMYKINQLNKMRHIKYSL
jgi:hypothetical protein